MKKTLVTLAILAASVSAAYAQTAVTVYGVVDLGIASERGANTKNSLLSGNQSGSRLGFKGTEDLGDGLKANFVLENGFNADAGSVAQSGLLFGRRATVGLSGAFGEVNLGRRNTPFYNAIDSVDPMSVGFAGNATNLITKTGTRMDNAVIYTSPQFNGVSGEVAYGFGEVPGDNTSNRQLSASAAYVLDRVSVSLAHHDAKDATGANTTKNTVIGGKYKFDVASAHLAYVRNSGNPAVDSNDWLVGVTVPLGTSTVRASYIRKDDKTAFNNDAKQLALAYTYDLSARTNFYTSYAKINNDNLAVYKTNGAFGDREVNVGIRHRF